MLFEPTLPVLSYYSDLPLRGYADIGTQVRTIFPIDYAFMVGAMFVVYASDEACFWYYTYNPRSENIGGSLQSRLPVKIVIELLYFSLNTFAHGIDSGPVQTGMAFHRCIQADSDKPGFETDSYPTNSSPVRCTARKRNRRRWRSPSKQLTVQLHCSVCRLLQ